MNNEQIEIGKFLIMGDWPDEILPTIKQLAQEFQWFVPLWCQRATIIYSPNYEDPMTCQLQNEYRLIRLRVGPSLLDDTPAHRRETFIHELIHGFLLPFNDYACDSIERALPDDENPKLKSVILEELRERNEQATQDLAFVLARKI